MQIRHHQTGLFQDMKNFYLHRAPAFVFAFCLAMQAGVPSAFAQNEPSQLTLSPYSTTVVDPAAQEAQGQQQGLQQDQSPDAMPQVNRLRIQTEGFGPGTPNSVVVDYDANPETQSEEELQEEIRREAFDAAVTGLFPLKPDEIEQLLENFDDTKRAVESPVYELPRPEVSVQTISLDPGVMPPEIKTSVGHVTTLNILDVTGAPWPIQDVSWAGDYEIIEPEEGGHMIRITPMAHFAYGNMSIRLLTLKTPITFSLRTERDSVHYRVDARIPEFGPFAKAPLIDGGSELVAGNDLLTAVLDGTPPGEAVRLAVSGVDGRTTAYKIRNVTYVRTPLTLLSPGWESSVSSADGMHVYALNDTPVLLLSDQGRFTRAHLREEEDLFDE